MDLVWRIGISASGLEIPDRQPHGKQKALHKKGFVDKPLRGSSTVFLMQAWRSRPACKVSKLTHMSSAWTDFIVFPKFFGFSGTTERPAMQLLFAFLHNKSCPETLSTL